MTSTATFENALAFGKIGESYIAAWLRVACKYHVLPVYEKQINEGKGPVLWAQDATELIAPDLLCWRPAGILKAKIRWVEAKTKSAFTWHRLSSQWTTGIDLHHYEHYRRVAKLSPWPVWLLFLHLDGRAKDSPIGSPTGLFGAEMQHLIMHEHHRHSNHGKSGMVYWAHSTLTRLATLDQVAEAMKKERPLPFKEHYQRPLSVSDKSGAAPTGNESTV